MRGLRRGRSRARLLCMCEGGSRQSECDCCLGFTSDQSTAYCRERRMSFVIRTLRPDDRTQWGTLWRGYLEFYETVIPDEVSELTWRRLLDPEAPILGFCADDGGKLIGIVHYLFHPVTWAAGPRC